MLKVFGQTDRDFSSNGDIILRPLKAKIHKEDNGDYYLELVTGLEYSDYLTQGRIIVANTPQGDQAFRINNPEKNKSKITIKAWHVFYDTERHLVASDSFESYSIWSALYSLNDSAYPQSPFVVKSDIATEISYECIGESLYKGIMDVLGASGGHLVRDNFNYSIMQEIGQDVGVTVEYKKNLKDIDSEEDWDDVVTDLLPVGKDGIMLNSLVSTVDPYVHSYIQYGIPYVKTVTFTQDHIKPESYETETAYKQALINDLTRQAYVYVDMYNKPKVNYTLKANIEKLTDIGDVIHVKDKRLGVDLLTSVISFDYDCILDKYTEVEFGNFRPTLSGLVTNIADTVRKDMRNTMYPIGSIYMSVNNTDPSKTFGGTWQSISSGQTGVYMWKRIA